MIIIQTVTPLNPNLNRFHHVAYSNGHIPHFIAKQVLNATCIQVSRDVEIWNRKNIQEETSISREDQSIMKYRRWISQFYTKRIMIDEED